MKNLLILTIIFSGLTGVGFAQNVSKIKQSGDSQTGTVKQNGNHLKAIIRQTTGPSSVTNTNNEAVILQTGTWHEASIKQTKGSEYNRAGITQDGNTGTGNIARIQQISSGGNGLRGGDPANAIGEGNWAGIFQRGGGNKSYVHQNGQNNNDGPPASPVMSFGSSTQKNFGEIWQYGTDNGTTHKTGEVWIDQSGSYNNRADIFQGDDSRNGSIAGTYSTSLNVTGNGATIDQTGGSIHNSATVRQFSNKNKATVRQYTDFIGSSQENITDIRQGLGDNQAASSGNNAEVNQISNATSNTAIVLQYGRNNNAEVDQYAWGSSVSNLASITQTAGANKNDAYIYQGGLNIGDNTHDNVALIKQEGEKGDAIIYQQFNSTYNYASIHQGVESTKDYSKIAQTQSANGVVTITQNLTATGSQNSAEVGQGDYNTTATSSTATVSQEGKHNSVALQQNGRDHKATITQNGKYNTVKGPGSNVAGDFDNDDEMALQDGIGQQMTITQTGKNSSITNTADVQQLGNGNILIGTQTATNASNLMTVRQDGVTNVTTITQNGVNN